MLQLSANKYIVSSSKLIDFTTHRLKMADTRKALNIQCYTHVGVQDKIKSNGRPDVMV